MKSHKSGSGSHTFNGVRETMNAPFAKAARSTRGTGPGIDGHNKAPFEKGQDVGNGGIPTRFFDEGMGKGSAGSGTTAGQVSPPKSSPSDMGKRRY